MTKTFLIKLGGSVLHDEKLMESLCEDLKQLKATGVDIIIVHGGSKAINQQLAVNNIESNMIDGLRVTTPEAMKIIEMVLCGHVNKLLVRKLNALGVNAIGLSGADNNMLSCNYYSKEHGCVGAIDTVNVNPIFNLLPHAIPVISPIGVDADGNPMNINADYVASYLANAMKVDQLIYITDKNGIYDKDGNSYSELTKAELIKLIEDKVVADGMLTKAKAVISALSGCLNSVQIINGTQKNVFNHSGTVCKNSLNHIITGDELSKSDIESILALAEKLKKEDPQKSAYANFLKGKNIALIFEKPSLRTRFSFTAGINQLGGHVIESITQTRKHEEPKDFIRVIQNYCSAVVIRASDDNALAEMQQYSKVPIINALTDMFHPCQTLADLLTLKEKFKNLENLKVAYIGDGNNILHSLMMMASKLGITVHYCCPKGCEPQQKYPLTKVFSDPKEAVKNCHAVYTDVWTSMGFEQKDESLFEGLQVNEELMSHAEPNAVFMHCMPMERGKEVSQNLPDSECSVIFQQSENRLHVQKALLISLLS